MHKRLTTKQRHFVWSNVTIPRADKPLVPPGDATEFEVQAFLFYSLRKAGYYVRGEVLASTSTLSRSARFDLVIFNKDGTPRLTIEVKKKDGAKDHTKRGLYEAIAGCPNIQISGLQQAKGVLTILELNGLNDHC
jgi:hypothetical protein